MNHNRLGGFVFYNNGLAKGTEKFQLSVNVEVFNNATLKIFESKKFQ